METKNPEGRNSSNLQIIRFFRESLTVRLLSWILLFAMLNLTGCRNYYQVSKPKNPTIETLENYRSNSKYILIISGENVFRIRNLVFENGNISGIAEQLKDYNLHINTKPEGPNRFKFDQEPNLLRTVHIYTRNFNPDENKAFTFSVDSITKIEFYKSHALATIGSHLLGVAIVSGVLILLFIISDPITISF